MKRIIALVLILCLLTPQALIIGADAAELLVNVPVDIADLTLSERDLTSDKITRKAGSAASAMATSSSNPVYVEGEYLYSYAFEALELINADRVSNGLPKLVMTSSLLNVAVQRSAELTVYYGTTRPNGTSFSTLYPSYSYSIVARERVLGNTTVARVAEKMREQISSYADYNTVGISCFRHNGVLYWALDFCTATSTTYASQPEDVTKVVKIDLGAEYYTGGIYAETSMDVGESQEMQMYLDNPEWANTYAFLHTDYTTFASTNSEIATVSGNVVTAVSPGLVEITASSGNQNVSMELAVRMDDCNHQWGSGEITTIATCTSDGEYTYRCIICGQIQRDVIPAWDHYYLDDRCTNCGHNTREDGSELYPYNIDTVEEFQSIAGNAGVHYKLMTDLTLPDGFQIEAFSGTLDGNGHTLTLTGNNALISYVTATGTIKNLTVDANFLLDLSNYYEVGIICLENCGVIENCIVNGRIKDEDTTDVLERVNVGGICAQNYGSIVKCKNDADISLYGYDLKGLCIESTPAYIGGIAGANYGNVESCWNDGYITVYLTNTADYSVWGIGYIGGVVGIGHAINCATGADLDIRVTPGYGKPRVYGGYIYGEEIYIQGTSSSIGLSINRCMVSENSTLAFEYNYDSYPYRYSIPIDKTVHENVTNKKIEDWWNKRNDPNPEPDGLVYTSVRYFARWEADQQIAHFGSSNTDSSLFLGSGCAVSENTDSYFTEHVDSLLNTYCLVSTKMRLDGKLGPDELLTVIPVETNVGTITSVEAGFLYINQTAYPFDPELISYPEWYDDCYVRYHVLNGQVVGLWLLTQPADTEIIEKVTSSSGASIVIRPFVLDAGLVDSWFEEGSEDVVLNTVNNDNISYLEDGFVIPRADAFSGSLTLSREGYRDYIIPSKVSTGIPQDANNSKVTTIAAYMQEDRGDGEPYISTVFIRNESTGFLDARYEQINLKENRIYTVVATAVGLESKDVTYYLAQNAENQIAFEGGLLVDTLYDKFDFSDDIFIYAVDSDGNMTRPEKVKIEKHVDMNDDLAALISSDKLNLLSYDGKGFKINDEIPLVGGLNLNMNAFDAPFGVEVDGNTVKITIGLDIFSASKSESENDKDDVEPDVELDEFDRTEDKYNYVRGEYEKNEIEKEEMSFKFSQFKNLVTGEKPSKDDKDKKKVSALQQEVIDSIGDFDDMTDFYKRCEEMFPGSVTKLYKTHDKAFNVGAIGYLEAVILNGQLVIKEYAIALQGNAMYKYTQQGAIWAVPAYFYVEGKGEIKVEFGGEAQLVGGDMPMDFGIKLDVTPTIAVGGGVGVADAASVGVRGEGSLPYHNNFSTKYHHLYVNASFSVEAKFFLLEGNKTLLETKDPIRIFDTYYGQKSGAKALSIVPPSDEASTTIRVVSRDYADSTSRWLGNQKQAQLMGVADAANAGVSFRTLQSSVFDRSQPQLVNLGNQMLMVWVEDDASRDDYNRMRLVYSVYNGLTNTWSTGKPVYDDGHNDAYPVLATDGTNTYVAWQKINKTLTQADCTSLDATLENSEIFVASFNGTAFTDVRQITSNQVYDYAPAISIVNGNALVYYVSSAGNDLQATGTHTLMRDQSGKATAIANNLNYVLATAAQGSNMSLIMDADGDITTTSDINVYTLSGTALVPFEKIGNELAYTSAAWGELDGADTLFVTDGVNIYYMADGERHAILENDRQIGGNLNANAFSDGTMVLWTEDADGTNEVFSVTCTDGVWTKPVQVSQHDVRITGMDTVSRGGKVVGVCNTTEVAYNESLNEYQALQTDLCMFETNDFSDLVVLDQVTFLESETVPGSVSPVTVLLENDGTTHIDQVTFTLTDTLGTKAITTVDVDLMPGDTNTVTLEYPVPANYAASTLTIRADTAQTDIDPDNNTVSLDIGHTDVSIREAKISNSGSVYVLRTIVDNISAIDADEVTLTVCLDETDADPIQTSVIGVIPSGSYATAELRLDETLLTFDETGAARIFVIVETASSERNISNNRSLFAVAPLEVGTCAHVIVDDVASLAPTCIKEGYTAGKACAACGAVLEPTERIAPTGHNYTYEVTLAPTLFDCGVLMGRCTHCFGMDYQIFPALSEAAYTRQVVRQPGPAEAGIARYTWKVKDYGVYDFDVEIPLATAESSAVDVFGIRWYSMAFEVLELTNQARAEQGLAPLVMTESLLETAMMRSEELSVYYSHTRPDGSSCFTVFPADATGKRAENIAANYYTAASVANGWLNSPGHYANIMNPDLNTIGIGCFYHNGVYYWTQCFAQSTGTACTQPNDAYYISSVELGNAEYNLLINGDTEMTVGDSQTLLAGIFNPGFTSACAIFENDSLTWASGDPSIATVEDGVVTARSAGTVSIWAYAGVNSASITLNILPGESQVTFTSASISLAGDIGINFYAQLSDDIIADDGAYMEFTVAGKTRTVPLSQAIVENGSYRFSCSVNAKQMTDVVTAQMYTSAGPVGQAKTYSVKEYADRLFAYIDSTGTTAFDSVVPLVKAMLNYGAYSQLCFGYRTDDLANADLPEADRKLPASVDLSRYAHSITGSEEGIQVYSASLLLESETRIRFYFRLTGSKSIDDYTFTVDGKAVTPTRDADGTYYVDKANVAAKDLDTACVASVGGLSVTYYGLSYARSTLSWSGSTEALVNIAKALYVYNQAANSYFGA